MALSEKFNSASAAPEGSEQSPTWQKTHTVAAGGIVASGAESLEKVGGKTVAATTLRGVSKLAPMAGMALTAHSAYDEVLTNMKEGKGGKALAAAVAGGFELTGGIFGFGMGDAAREAARAAIGKVFGHEYMPDKSGLRELGSLGCAAFVAAVEKSRRDTQASISAQQQELLEKDPGLPKNVTLPDGREVSIALALKNQAFRTAMRDSLLCSGTDCSKQVATLDRFAELETATAAEYGRATPARRKTPAPGGQTV